VEDSTAIALSVRLAVVRPRCLTAALQSDGAVILLLHAAGPVHTADTANFFTLYGSWRGHVANLGRKSLCLAVAVVIKVNIALRRFVGFTECLPVLRARLRCSSGANRRRLRAMSAAVGRQRRCLYKRCWVTRSHRLAESIIGTVRVTIFWRNTTD
jgi:hypothetical protein